MGKRPFVVVLSIVILAALLVSPLAVYFSEVEASQQTVALSQTDTWSLTTLGTTYTCSSGNPLQDYPPPPPAPLCQSFPFSAFNQVSSLYTGIVYQSDYVITDFIVAANFDSTCNPEDSAFTINCILTKDDVPIAVVTLSPDAPSAQVSTTTGWTGSRNEQLRMVVSSPMIPAGDCGITSIAIGATVNGYDL